MTKFVNGTRDLAQAVMGAGANVLLYPAVITATAGCDSEKMRGVSCKKMPMAGYGLILPTKLNTLLSVIAASTASVMSSPLTSVER